MLTKQGNTQVYSPFGSYVVEQHRPVVSTPSAAFRSRTRPNSRRRIRTRRSSGKQRSAAAYWSFVTSARAVPSTSAITRNVLASNSMPIRRMPVTAVSAFTPSACF